MSTVASIMVHVGANIADFQNKMGQTQGRLSGIGDSMVGTGKKMTMGVTAPILGMGAAILTTAADFESNMKRVEAVSGATGKDLQALEDQAKTLGSTTQFSASQAAEGMTYLTMAGFDANETLSAMPGVLNLAAAGQLDLATASDIASNVLTGFGKNAEEIGRVNDVMAKTSASANTDITQLGNAMTYVAPIANSAGMSIEETSAIIGKLSDAGIQGSMAGTTLRGSISKLLAPSEKASGIMGDLGLNVTKADGSLRPMHEIVQQLADSGATTADMMEIFGQRAGPGMAALVEQGAEGLIELQNELENSGGTAQEMADKQMEGLSGAIKRVQSALEGAAIAIADTGLLEMVTSWAERLANLISRLSEANPAILKWGVIIAGVLAAAGPLLIVLGMMVKGIAALGPILAVLTGPIGLIILGLVALGAALIMAWKHSETFRDIVTNAFQKILRVGDAVRWLWVLLRDGVLTFIQALKGDWTDASGIRPFHRIMGRLGTLIRDVVVPAFHRFVDFISTHGPPAIDFLKTKALELWNAFKIIGGFIAGSLIPVIQKVVGWFRSLGGRASGLGDAIRERLNPFIELFKDNLDILAGPVGLAFRMITAFADALDKDGLGAAFKAAGAELWDFITSVIAFQSEYLPLLFGLLLDLGQALVDWIGPYIGPALSKLAEWGGALIGWITGTAVPWLAEKAAELGRALVDWITDVVPPVLSGAADLLSQLGGWITGTAVPWLADKAIELGSALVDWVTETIPKLLSKLGEWATAARDWLINTGIPSFADAISEGVPALIEAIGNLFSSGTEGGIDTATPGILEKIGSIASGFIEWVAPLGPPLLEAVGGLLTQLGEWITGTALPTIAEKVLEWGRAFWQWVVPAVGSLLLELGVLLVRLGEWIAGTAAPAILEKLAEWGRAFWQWVIPAAGSLLLELGVLLVRLGEWVTGTALPAIAEKLIEWGRAFWEWVVPAAGSLLLEIGVLLVRLSEWITGTALPAIAEKLIEWGRAFWEWVIPAMGSLLIQLGELLVQLGSWIVGTALPAIAEKLVEWGRAFWEWVVPAIGSLLLQLGELLAQLGSWIVGTALPAIAEKVVEWGRAFWQWVVPATKSLLLELGSLLLQLGSWIVGTAVPAIIENLVEWTRAFWQWVAKVVPPLLLELGALLADLGNWIVGTAAPAIIEHLVEWTRAFWQWVAKVFPSLVMELGALLSDIGDWIVETAAPAIVEKLGEWVSAFIDWVGDVVEQLPGVLWDIVNAISTWVTETAWEEIKGIGSSIANGIVDGIKSIDITGAVTGALGGAFEAGKNSLGINSPSKLFATMGEFMMTGIMMGIDDQSRGVIDRVAALSDGMAAAFQPELLAQADVLARGAVASGPSRAFRPIGPREDGSRNRTREQTITLDDELHTTVQIGETTIAEIMQPIIRQFLRDEQEREF